MKDLTYVIVALILIFFSFITIMKIDKIEKSLLIPDTSIISIDTITTYECMANDLDSLIEKKTIKIIYHE